MRSTARSPTSRGADFLLGPDDEAFDLAFAVRVGVLDGRHPGTAALAAVRAALRPGGRLVVDGVERVLGPPAGDTGQH